MYGVGFRKALTFEGEMKGELDNAGSYVLLEVENAGAEDVKVMVNHYPQGGHVGTAIPVKAGTTRTIPMRVYRFEATGPVTVVAYGM